MDSILRAERAAAVFGVSRSTFWAWNNPKSRYYRPDFPKPIKISTNATGWRQSELEAYIQKLAAQRKGETP